jgi:hypothetical protein
MHHYLRRAWKWHDAHRCRQIEAIAHWVVADLCLTLSRIQASVTLIVLFSLFVRFTATQSSKY